MINLDFTVVELVLLHQLFEFTGQQILMLIGDDLQAFLPFTNEGIEMLDQVPKPRDSVLVSRGKRTGLLGVVVRIDRQFSSMLVRRLVWF